MRTPVIVVVPVVAFGGLGSLLIFSLALGTDGMFLNAIWYVALAGVAVAGAGLAAAALGALAQDQKLVSGGLKVAGAGGTVAVIAFVGFAVVVAIVTILFILGLAAAASGR